MTKKLQEYTNDFKQGAIKMVLEEGLSRSEVGRRLGTSSKNVSRWVREFESQNKPISSSDNSLTLLEKRNAELEKENRRLKMEREILKKAAAFFANESH